MDKPIRLGVVGTGLQWQGSHQPALLSMPDRFEIRAAVVRDPVKLSKAIGEISGLKIYPTYASLVVDPDIDAVVVCMPIALNAPVTIAALDAGKHVFVEKPFAHNVLAGEQVIDAAHRAKRRVMILEQLLYTDAWDEIRAVIASGEIGTLAMYDHASHGFLDTQHDPWGFGKTTWRVHGEFPLGSMFDGGVHEVALRAKLFGKAEKVYARGQNFRAEHGEYDNVNAIFEHAHGVQGVVTHSGLMGGKRGYFHIRGTKGLIAVEFWRAIIENKIDGTTREIQFAESAGAFFKNLHSRMWRELAECLQNRQPDRYPPAQALEDLKTLEAVERSIKSGVVQVIP